MEPEDDSDEVFDSRTELDSKRAPAGRLKRRACDGG